MAIWQHHEDPLRPQLRAVAAGPIPFAGQKGDVETELPDGGDMLLGIAVDQLDPDVSMPEAIGVEQFGEEAGSDGRIDADPHPSLLGTSSSGYLICAFTDRPDRSSRTMKKTLTCKSLRHSPCVSVKE